MKKDITIKELQDDEENGNGEVLDITDEYVCYFDYDSDTEIFYRFDEACTDEYIKSRIFVSEDVQKKGFTPDYIIKVLKKAFGDWYFDTVCVMSGIVIASNEADFDKFIQNAMQTSDIAREWYEYADEEKYCGKLFAPHQIAYINERKHVELAKELADEMHSAEYEYEIGIIITLIHEMRHMLLECHHFISEDDIPLTEATEEAVEDFARDAYENLGELKHFCHFE